MKSTTVKWNPPTAEELPCNWSVQAMRYAPASYGDDGGAYKSRDGLIVIISCSMATPRLTPTKKTAIRGFISHCLGKNLFQLG
jgi:hypothetical protein